MNASGFVDKLSAMLNINTMSSSDTSNNNATGRPKKEDGSLTDSGLETRSKASNIEKGGNI